MSDSVREFLSDWWRSRDWGLFRWGLFSMVGGIGLIVLLLFAELQSSWERSGEYLGVARYARAKGNLESATIFYEKALQERQDDVSALFEWMVVSDELGERSSRDATLGYLVDEAGHLPALLYAGRLALREGRVDEAKEILKASLDRIPEKERGPGTVLAVRADEIRRGLMRVQWRGGAFRDAIELGNQLIDPVLRDEMDLAVLYLRAGDLKVAKQKAATLRDRLGTSSEQAEVDLFSAFAESVMGRGVEAMRMLDRAAQRGAARQAILEARVRCFELLRISMDALPDLRLIEPAAEGGTPAVVGPLIGMISDGAVTDEFMVEAVVGGEVPLVSHLVAGLRALRGGKEGEARLHFSLANELSPVTGPLLGWCGVRLAQTAGRDREALFLADLVTSLAPKSDGLLRKGQILRALGRWEALEILLEDETLPIEARAAFREEIEMHQGRGGKARN